MPGYNRWEIRFSQVGFICCGKTGRMVGGGICGRLQKTIRLKFCHFKGFLANPLVAGLFQRVVKENRDNSDTSGACGGIVRSSDPVKFISNLSKSADQLLGLCYFFLKKELKHF